jgi:putative thioredoxin
LRKIVDRSPNHDEAWLLLAELLLAQRRPDESRQIVAQLEQRGYLEPAAQTLKAKLDLEVRSHEKLEDAEQLARANPGDHVLQLAYAQALAAHGQYEACFEICLGLVTKDRKATGEQARELMVNVFRALPEDSDLTRDYRRQLSMLLY